MLSAKDILAHSAVDIDRVHVAEFGGEVCVRSLSAAAADLLGNKPEDIPTNVFLTILGACDEKGAPLFTMENAKALGEKPSKALTTIAAKVLDHNGLGAKAGDEAKNGSSETENDASVTASPLPSGEASQN